jgi:hypothetical protein
MLLSGHYTQNPGQAARAFDSILVYRPSLRPDRRINLAQDPLRPLNSSGSTGKVGEIEGGQEGCLVGGGLLRLPALWTEANDYLQTPFERDQLL